MGTFSYTACPMSLAQFRASMNTSQNRPAAKDIYS